METSIIILGVVLVALLCVFFYRAVLPVDFGARERRQDLTAAARADAYPYGARIGDSQSHDRGTQGRTDRRDPR